MKLVTHTFLTLDGVMQGPGGAEEDLSGGFGRGGWLVPFSDADMGVIVESWFARTEALLLGRNTYETMHAYWSQVTDPANRAAARLNHGRKYVVSNTLTRADWPESRIASGGLAEDTDSLKHEPGGVILAHPVVIGHGTGLFSSLREPLRLDLVEARTFPSGTAIHVYRPSKGNR